MQVWATALTFSQRAPQTSADICPATNKSNSNGNIALTLIHLNLTPKRHERLPRPKTGSVLI